MPEFRFPLICPAAHGNAPELATAAAVVTGAGIVVASATAVVVATITVVETAFASATVEVTAAMIEDGTTVDFKVVVAAGTVVVVAAGIVVAVVTTTPVEEVDAATLDTGLVEAEAAPTSARVLGFEAPQLVNGDANSPTAKKPTTTRATIGNCRSRTKPRFPNLISSGITEGNAETVMTPFDETWSVQAVPSQNRIGNFPVGSDRHSPLPTTASLSAPKLS